MEKENRKENRKEDRKEDRTKMNPIQNTESTTGDNLFAPRNALKSTPQNESFRKSNQQTNEEIAEQGFTVRDGHNPNKPNPDEKLDIHRPMEAEDGFEKDREFDEEIVDSDEKTKKDTENVEKTENPFMKDLQEIPRNKKSNHQNSN